MGATATVAALGDYFVQRFNLANRDAEYKKNRVTLARLRRDAKRLTMGSAFFETVRIADAYSGSTDFTTGMSVYNVSQTFRWLVGAPFAQYGRLTFEGLLLKQNDTGTIIDLKSTEADGVAMGMLDTVERNIWQDGFGDLGQISVLGGSAAVRVITLAVASDVYNFLRGMPVVFNVSRTAAGANRTDIYVVTSLNPVTAQVTLTRTSGAAGDVAANDFAFVQGTKDTAGGVAQYMPGIPQFIPAADPSDTLYGVTRSGDPAISGWRFPFEGSMAETIQRAFSKMGRFVNRAAANFAVCLSTNDWLTLSLEPQSQVVRDPTAMQRFGVDGLSVNTPYGPVTCIMIPQMRDGRGYILDWTSWVLYTLGNLPHVINDDGNIFLRLAPGSPTGNTLNGDGIEMRFRLWTVLLCNNPISNCTFLTA
jgi:hypothetical protein